MHRPGFAQLAALFPECSRQVAEPDRPVHALFFDSRRVRSGENGLFFAFSSRSRDGHDFIPELSQKGVRNWVLTDPVWAESLSEAEGHNWMLVHDPVEALHRIVAWYRRRFDIPIVGITGSNGKTIVKEWLAQLLAPDFLLCKSPGSFNSQIGLPVSVWQLESNHQLGIFEAGISLPGEMAKLEAILKPTLGILTKFGTAHQEGFPSEDQKFREKASLFRDCPQLVLSRALLDQHIWLLEFLPETQLLTWTWSTPRPGLHRLEWQGAGYDFRLPFSDPASVENLGNTVATALLLGLDPVILQERLTFLHGSDMRLSMKEGIAGTLLVDDTYTNDRTGLEAALQFARLQCRENQELVVVCSEFEEDSHDIRAAHRKQEELWTTYQVDKVYRIGPERGRGAQTTILASVAEALALRIPEKHPGSVLLVKGSRRSGLEALVKAWQKKIHGTRLEINLDSLVHNLNFYRSQVQPGTRIMAMVKALGYGAGEEEVVRTLVYHGVDYLAVAYADEGVKLREAGIRTPILVLNPPDDALGILFEYNLEPELYSFRMLRLFEEALRQKGEKPAVSIHLKLDTGMHRLGFLAQEKEDLAQWLVDHTEVRVASVFSHLAGSDETRLSEYSRLQIDRFSAMCRFLEEKTGRVFRKHILNSAGILRFPDAQFDWVRLGIGLYGVEVNSWFQNHLEPVSQLKTTISQIKSLKAGESVGYGRRTILERDSRVATLAIGYSDGFRRALSAGKGRVKIAGKWVPVLGNVCMDMCMVDVTDTRAEEGDEAVIFEDADSLMQLADAAGTIPYEILTGIGHRVKRIFFRA